MHNHFTKPQKRYRRILIALILLALLTTEAALPAGLAPPVRFKPTVALALAPAHAAPLNPKLQPFL